MALLRILLAILPLWGCIRTGSKPDSPVLGMVRSNIERKDYAGSKACARCHVGIYNRFVQSPMHNMTRWIEGAEIKAPFDGREFHFKDDKVFLETVAGQRRMRIESAKYGHTSFRVTKVIGGHHREDFAGKEIGAPDSAAEKILPVSYMLDSGRFRYKGYSVMIPERDGLRVGPVWKETCLFCHNTVPLLSTALGELAGDPSPSYQGRALDPMLPPDRRWSLEVADSGKLVEALEKEIRFLIGQSNPATFTWRGKAREAAETTRHRFDKEHLVEMGIGCESCHGGSREHAANPRVLPSLEPRSPFLRVKRPHLDSATLHSRQEIRACARCHQVLFSAYPWTWENGRRHGENPGGAHINSGEARDMLLGNCQVSCTACHDPHSHDDRVRRIPLEGPAGNRVCVQCHEQYRSPDALKTHARHKVDGPGGLCINCHMPRKNMSLDTRLTRYHRIGSPNENSRVEGDRPLECALCHIDKSVRQLVDSMESWWPRSYERSKLESLYGSLDANPLIATLRLGKPHEKAVALYLAGIQKDPRLASRVARELVNPRPIVRYYAEEALMSLTGGSSPLDLHGEKDSIRRAAKEWLESFGLTAP